MSIRRILAATAASAVLAITMSACDTGASAAYCDAHPNNTSACR